MNNALPSVATVSPEPKLSADIAGTLLAVLGHRVRIDILRKLAPFRGGGLTAGRIAARLDITPSSLSYHLQQLTKAGVLESRHASRKIIYSVNVDLVALLCSFLTETITADEIKPLGSRTPHSPINHVVPTV